MTEKEPNSLRTLSSFMKKVYPLNLQGRWNDTPHMKNFASQEDLESIGIFETVSGHVWMCQLLCLHIKKTCSSLRQVVDFENVNDRLTIHDIGETLRGDISLTSKVDSDFDMDKDGERKDFLILVSDLPDDIAEGYIKWFDDFESEPNDNTPFEVLVARWADSLQGSLTLLIFGNDLPEHSETIERVMKVRSVLRARQLINALMSRCEIEDDSYHKAAKEVDGIAREQVKMMKEAGLIIDLSDFGF